MGGVTPDRDPAGSIELARFAVELATGAAAEVRRALAALSGGDMRTDAKSTATDLVTATDRASEQWLVERILTARPGDGVLGEEGADRAGSSGVRWVLDPIDGTVNFVLGLPAYAVSVAAEVDGIVVAGAVCNVASGELFRARLGGGAYLYDQPLTGPRSVPLSRAVIGTGFGYDASRRARQIAVVAELLPQVADIRRIGAASLDLCSVAAGRLDGYFEAGLNPWDYAAGALVAAEAGCVVTGLRGREPSTVMTVAAGTSCATELTTLLEVLGADDVL
ncbi:MAG: inositol monophosphatase [Jatrophihabitans sp.]|nr:inositol monophosphatase [Jatrophihabitans sp.]